MKVRIAIAIHLRTVNFNVISYKTAIIYLSPYSSYLNRRFPNERLINMKYNDRK